MELKSLVMASLISQLTGCGSNMQASQRRNSFTPEISWPNQYDFSGDASLFLEEAERKRAEEVFETKQELDYVPIDREFKSEKQYKVFYDENKKPWDAYLTKIDLKNGPYGDYVYYKL